MTTQRTKILALALITLLSITMQACNRNSISDALTKGNFVSDNVPAVQCSDLNIFGNSGECK